MAGRSFTLGCYGKAMFQISGKNNKASKMTEALEFNNHPAAEALYETGEH